MASDLRCVSVEGANVGWKVRVCVCVRCVCVCVHLSAVLWSTKCVTIGDPHCTSCQSR